jgi:hypothetical protein
VKPKKMKQETHEFNGHTFSIGDRVSARVEWTDGRRTWSTGTLRLVWKDKAYIETSIGNVEADAETMEPAP